MTLQRSPASDSRGVGLYVTRSQDSVQDTLKIDFTLMLLASRKTKQNLNTWLYLTRQRKAVYIYTLDPFSQIDSPFCLFQVVNRNTQRLALSPTSNFVRKRLFGLTRPDRELRRGAPENLVLIWSMTGEVCLTSFLRTRTILDDGHGDQRDDPG